MKSKRKILKKIVGEYNGKGGPTSVRTPNVPYKKPKPIMTAPTPAPKPTPPGGKFPRPTPPDRFTGPGTTPPDYRISIPPEKTEKKYGYEPWLMPGYTKTRPKRPGDKYQIKQKMPVIKRFTTGWGTPGSSNPGAGAPSSGKPGDPNLKKRKYLKNTLRNKNVSGSNEMRSYYK